MIRLCLNCEQDEWDMSVSLADVVASNDAKALWNLISSTLEARDIASFGRVKDLLQQTQKLVASELLELQRKNNVVVLDDDVAGVTLGEMPDAQFLEPRGRFKTVISSTGLVLEGKSASCFVSWASVTHCACIPAHQSTKKEGEDVLVMRLAPDQVMFNGKALKNLLWNTQKTVGKPLSIAVSDGSVEAGPYTCESAVITSLVGKAWGNKIVKPRPDLFSTVTSKDPKPFLRCHKGTQEGAIYPLENGVVFIKPALFLPAEEIASINAGRGGGSGQTRFVDLMVETADESSYEFTNIERDELPALQGYVKGYLEVRAKEEAAKRAAEGGEEDDDSDEDDDDYDEDEDSADSNEDSDDSDDDSDDYADEDDDDTEDEEDGEKKKKEAKSSPVKAKEEETKPKGKKEKKERKDKDIRKKVSPKKRGSKVKAENEKGANVEGAAPQVIDLSSSSSSAAPLDPAAAMKAAYKQSFQVKREREGSENVSTENKKVKSEEKEGHDMDVEVAPTKSVSAPAPAPTVFVLEE